MLMTIARLMPDSGVPVITSSLVVFFSILANEDLTSIDGVGEVMAESILAFFRSEYNLEMLSKLKTFGLNFKDSSFSKDQNLILEGKIFVLTGSLTKFNREEASLRIEALGGKVSSSVSKKTTFLVAGPGAGSKLDKAQKLDIKVLSEIEFLEIINC